MAISSVSGSSLARSSSNDAQHAAELRRLQATDQRVREHERAHLAAAAGIATTPASFSYTQGPDGQRYAVAGEVGIDASPARTPQATLDKARRIEAAALAPADPSAQDYRVASSARAMAQEALQELQRQQAEETQSSGTQVDTWA